MKFAIILLGIVLAGLEARFAPGGWVYAYTMVVFLHYGLATASYTALISGLTIAVLGLFPLGVSSLIQLGYIGFLEFFMPKTRGEKRSLVDLALFLPFAIVEGVGAGSVRRFVAAYLGYLAIYGVMRFGVKREGAIRVRREL